jgi:hypothetical protein
MGSASEVLRYDEAQPAYQMIVAKINVKMPIMITAKCGEWYLSLTEAIFSGRILSKAIAKSMRLNVMK